ncbi:hypothetical protein NUW58_g8005 [Xylaria curta]|uniref:Uncharacterized protein n=1 Tax=Xylaria curta TaxID=42375 RepID=A0ACC1NBX1_9PEZI|nr:hypothetical protein NUW58_g8005 [Xylaria curta]
MQQGNRSKVHHTFNDGDFTRFGQMAAHVTVAQVDLKDPDLSPSQIDYALRQCLLHSRPVYIQVPVDMVPIHVPATGLQSGISIPPVFSTPSRESVVETIANWMSDAERPIILVDGETRAYGIVEDVQRLVKHTGWPSFTTAFGWGLLDETESNVFGIYRGSFDENNIHTTIQNSDLVLCFGPHFSSTNSYSFSSIPKGSRSILISRDTVVAREHVFRDIPAQFVAARLLERLKSSSVQPKGQIPDLSRPYVNRFSERPKGQPITHESFWPMMQPLIREGDIVLGETGSSGHGVRDIHLPKNVRTFLPVTWLSIGYMVGAAQGAALAQRELIASSQYHGINSARTILFIGDGSLQMTVQELGTIIRHNLNVTVVLINNDGYTIERVIHGMKQKYNDVASWNYLQAPAFFGADKSTYTAKVKTLGEVEQLMRNSEFLNAEGFKMVEVIMDREDAPKGPLTWLRTRQLGQER